MAAALKLGHEQRRDAGQLIDGCRDQHACMSPTSPVKPSL
jgi:hypothetical protein